MNFFENCLIVQLEINRSITKLLTSVPVSVNNTIQIKQWALIFICIQISKCILPMQFHHFNGSLRSKKRPDVAISPRIFLAKSQTQLNRNIHNLSLCPDS